MLFHTLEFAYFFAVVYALYRILGHQHQNRMLLVASYVFFGAWDWRYLTLIILSTTVDYFCALHIEKNDSSLRRKRLVALSVFVNLTLLGIFKYFDFFAISFQGFAGYFGIEVTPFILDVVLPIGISFYTFQTMSYTIDVYRKKLPAAHNYLDFALYVSFFPQLIAGPIERGTNLLPQVLRPRQVTWEMLHRGIYLFLWGLFLKLVIADNMARLADPVFASPAPYQGIDVLIGVYAFSFQIYGDFAGYSFMAIGLASTMGFTLMENFRRPYFAENLQEFWRRWHISLSTWFRDYLYIPLGGSEKGTRRTLINVAITFILCGLWHGAGWTFALWGAYHAGMLGVYRVFRRHWDRMNRFLQIILTYHIVCGGWLLFRAETASQAREMAAAVFTNFQITHMLAAAGDLIKVILPLMMLLFIQISQSRANDSLVVLRWLPYFRYPLFWILIFLIVGTGSLQEAPFLYFQF